jgi:hypothetical protein
MKAMETVITSYSLVFAIDELLRLCPARIAPGWQLAGQSTDARGPPTGLINAQILLMQLAGAKYPGFHLDFSLCVIRVSAGECPARRGLSADCDLGKEFLHGQ